MAKHPQKQGQRNAPSNHVLSTQWAGPLPPPAALEHFDRVIPGGGTRILAMAEKEQAHRIAVEQVSLTASIADHRRGQWLGALIAASAIAGAAANAFAGGAWQVSVALVGVPILGVVQALIPWANRDGPEK